MKNLLRFIFAASVFALPLSTLAAECPSDTPLNKTFQLQVQLVTPLNSIDKDTFLGVEQTAIYFSKGVPSTSYWVGVGRSTYERQIVASFNNDDIKSGTIQPFTCSVTQLLQKTLSSDEVSFSGGCPIAKLYLARQVLDPRQAMYTTGSLQYNLGSQFKVIAECNN